MNLNYKTKIKNDADIKIRLYYKYIMEEKILNIQIINNKYISIPRVNINLFIKEIKKICCNCGEEGKMMRCNKCDSAHYCSKECQKEDHIIHKRICNLISEKIDYNKKKTYYYNYKLCDILFTEILEGSDLPNKLKKKKFWKFLTDPRNDDYLFTPCDFEELDEYIENAKKTEQCFDIKNYKYIVLDLENQWSFRTID